MTLSQALPWGVNTDHVCPQWLTKTYSDCPGGPVAKNAPANAGGKGLIPGLGRFHTQQGN